MGVPFIYERTPTPLEPFHLKHLYQGLLGSAQEFSLAGSIRNWLAAGQVAVVQSRTTGPRKLCTLEPSNRLKASE
ncbi:Uncharacterized protein HZ326_3312 [Fusarium oxysporum f. sp. albedinis]|nr:Uncharacterized protein HZ326_3312 [Fusarium oxysporum f. sp. albedinis]